MSNYQGGYRGGFEQHCIDSQRTEDHPAAASTETEDQPAPNYEARPAPADFQSFLDEISRMVRDQGGIQVDEDLWEDIFGGEDGLGRR